MRCREKNRARCRLSRCTISSLVRRKETQRISKGKTGDCGSGRGRNRVCDEPCHCGHQRDRISDDHPEDDREPAILALKQDVKLKAKDIEIILNEAPAGDNSANGPIELAVKDTKRQVRALLSELEENLDKIDDNHPIMSWLSRHAAFCLGRCAIKDRKTLE